MTSILRKATCLAAPLAAALILAWPGFAPAGHPAKSAFSLLDEPRPLPEIEFVDREGQTRTLADFRGRTVLLNIWATWCVPCREEMPALDRLEQTLGGPDFIVIPLSIDRDGLPAVTAFYQEYQLGSLGIYVDPWGDASGALRVIGIPTTLLIDRQGRELGRRVGPAEWDGEPIVAELRHYIAEDRNARAREDTSDQAASGGKP